MAEVNDVIDRQLAENADIPAAQSATQKFVPTYKKVGESRIPVSRHHGRLWESRIKQAKKKREECGVSSAWEEAISYFMNDQSGHREGSDGSSAGNRKYARFLGEKRFSETENIVYSNVRSLVPMLFSKNPSVEFTANQIADENSDENVRRLERLINTLASRRHMNLKKPLKRCVTVAQLTNGPWIEVGYTKREVSREGVLDEVVQLATALEKATSQEEIRRIEGKLQAIDEQSDVLQDPGPWVKFRGTDQVYFDPTSEEEDGCDGNWMACEEYLPTQYLLAVYAKDEDTDTPRSIFKPTHVMKLGATKQDAEDEVANFSLFDDNASYKEYGYHDQETFDRAKMTKVVRIWDKTTRRVYLFNCEDFAWPLWVWDDPYNLERFYPFFRLVFDLTPDGGEGVGEVSYYLDQQDAINEINSTERNARNRALGSVLYNSDVITDRTTIEKWLRGEAQEAIGISLGADTKLSDHIMPAGTPALQFSELFDKMNKYAAIDRISSANEILRGEQFKTNTTNKAISQYQDTTSVQLDDRLDSVEDFTGDILWAVAQMVIQFMPQEKVAELIGQKLADTWRNMEPKELRVQYSMRVVGGSTQKPTSQAKKQSAVEVGQVLGQFAQTPATLIVVLKMMAKAFDDVVITKEDWELIMQSIAGAGGPEGGTDQAGIDQLTKMIQDLPPEAQKAIGQAIAQGAPLDQAIQQVIQQLKGNQNGPE